MKLFRITVVIAVVLLWAGSGTGWAQAVAGSQLSGVVHDSSGLAIPGAEVTATKVDTGVIRTVFTGGDGAYLLPNLPVGPYQLKVVLQGFQTFLQDGIVLQVSSNPVINVTLSVGTIAEQVTVTANANLVETHSNGVGQVIDNQRVVELPLNGRQANELILLSGLAAPAPAQDLATNKNYPTTTISVAGGQANGITYIMDGATHNDPFNNLNLPTPFPDALQEFKVETSALPARYGHHAAAAVNVVTRSGTNRFSGNAFEFLRDYHFNATNYFAVDNDGLRRNQFGGTLGGPIVKNRVFFFGGYQGKVENVRPSTSQAFVPTAAMRAGDFTTFASPACNSGRQITLRAPFSGNRINPSQFSLASVKLLQYLPVADDPCGRVQYTLPNDNREHQGIAKVDYAVGSHTVSGRYLRALYDSPGYFDGQNALTLSRVGQRNVVDATAIGFNTVLSATAFNSFHLAVNRTQNGRTMPSYFSPIDLGINVSVAYPNYTNVNVSGTGFAIGTNAVNPGFFNSNVFQVADDFDLVRGNHQLAFGANWIRSTDLTEFYRLTNGEPVFNGTVAGLPLADFMLGLPATFTQNPTSRTNMLLDYVGVYAQDSWKASPTVTVNLGVRWEPFLPMENRDGRVYRFDAARFAANQRSVVYPNAPAGFTFPGDDGYPGNRATSIKLAQFAPRVGVIWSPNGDDRTSIRAAWGIFTDVQHLFFNAAFQGMGQSVAINNPAGGWDNPYLNYPGGNPYPKAGTLTASSTFAQFSTYATYPLNTEPTQLQQFNLSVQRQVGDWLLTAGYVGNRSSHLWVPYEINPAIYGTGATTGNTNTRRALYLQNPTQGQLIGSILAIDDSGTAAYNGMLLSVQRRMKNNVSLLANWTLSKCETDPVITELVGGAAGWVDPAHHEYDRGPCAHDKRHVVNLSIVTRTPSFKSAALRALASDWQIAPLVRWSSGSPASITTGVDTALTGVAAQRGVQVLSDPYGAGAPDGYLNPAAFTTAAPGTYTTLGVNSVVGPSQFQNDLAISRSISLAQHRTLQLRWEIFNVINRVNFNNPVTALNSANFGKIIAAGDPRIMQFAVKFEF